MKPLLSPPVGTRLHLVPMDLPPILGLAKLIRLRVTELQDLILRAHASPDLAHTCMQSLIKTHRSWPIWTRGWPTGRARC